MAANLNINPDYVNIEGLSRVNAYDNLENVRPNYGPVPIDWNDDLFNAIPIWSGVALDDNQVAATGVSVMRNIREGHISVLTAKNVLRLAMSLKSMVPGDGKYLIQEQARPLPDNNDPLLVGRALRVELPGDAFFDNTRYAPVVLPEMDNNNERGLGTNQTARPTPAVATEDTAVQLSTSYCFICAYLMKLLIKASDNIVLGIPAMKLRYAAFYTPTNLVNNFNITRVNAELLKAALTKHSLVLNTYTHAIAYTHQFRLSGYATSESGAMSYLCFLPFSYTGMHAYTLILDIFKKCNLDFGRLLRVFHCDATSAALAKIAQIVRELETTNAFPDRSVIFRYCTHWSPRYFGELRSKSCAYLLFVAACAWKRLNPHNNYSDPERIQAIQDIPVDLKRTLRAVGHIIASNLAQRMFTLNDAGSAYALGMRRMNVSLETGGEDGEDEVNDEDVL